MIAFPLLLPILETNNKESETKFMFIRIAIVLDCAIAGLKFEKKLTLYMRMEIGKSNIKLRHAF